LAPEEKKNLLFIFLLEAESSFELEEDKTICFKHIYWAVLRY
jgi:hypothetical protein